jgi:hypothetical protein
LVVDSFAINGDLGRDRLFNKGVNGKPHVVATLPPAGK